MPHDACHVERCGLRDVDRGKDGDAGAVNGSERLTAVPGLRSNGGQQQEAAQRQCYKQDCGETDGQGVAGDESLFP